MANQATYSRMLAYGLRDITNSWSDGVMNLQIADYSIREAIQDGLITQDAKQIMTEKYLACQSMEKPEVTIPSLIRPDTSDPDTPPLTQYCSVKLKVCIETAREWGVRGQCSRNVNAN